MGILKPVLVTVLTLLAATGLDSLFESLRQMYGKTFDPTPYYLGSAACVFVFVILLAYII